ncbi:MAG: endopeptidase La [Ignavibacteria bacterium]|nr:endopeptidase La [Ignavibacteria bacterium]
MSDHSEVLDSIEQADKRTPVTPESIPVLPLRDIVIYPHMIFPVLIGRASSLKSVAEALEREKYILVVSQKQATTDDAGFDDIHEVGTVAKILQVMRLPNNLLKVLVEGAVPARITGHVQTQPFLEAKIHPVSHTYDERDRSLMALIRHAAELFEEYVKDNRNLPPEVVGAFQNLEDPHRKLYYAAANIAQKAESKQRILDAETLKDQYYELVQLLSSELELLKLEVEIDTKVHDQIQKSQRKYFIQEQIRALQSELGEEDDGGPELSSLKEQLDKALLPESILAKVTEEFDRLKRTPSMSPEFGVNRTWLEWIASVPWNARTDDNMQISHVKKILDDDHYDLEKPKQRIMEYISVLNLVGSMRGQILCLTGPPGVGKTSLAKSIARALGRNFVRLSLGGVRDEAEIRGHRRTYIGAMPGKIIQAMKRAGSTNPVILLDEIDKMSMDFRGDPSAALLEVLDPEQNSTFNDHYLEVDYDLSNVLFIATANVKYNIPGPLLDRLEVIELSSYLEPDKVQIAKKYIIPKLQEKHGLSDFNIKIPDTSLLKLVREYTREAGVRNLEREIASILRKVAMEVVDDVGKKAGAKPILDVKKTAAYRSLAKRKTWTIDEKTIERLLRAPKYKVKDEDLSDKVGVAVGLAWTSLGGDTLPVEVTFMPGPERLTLTGKLGDVMKESGMAALSFLRSSYAAFGLDQNFAKERQIHIHVPEGAIPKDGPSAGITISLAILSAASGRPLRGDVAMTGEVTLRGNVLAIGGLNEKLLAAKRAGMTTVLVPKDNKRDVLELQSAVTEGLTIVYVGHVSEAVKVALRAPAASTSASKTSKAVKSSTKSRAKKR